MHRSPLRSDEEHRAALAELRELLERDPDPGTAEDVRLEALVCAVMDFEEEHCPIAPASPEAITAFLCEQNAEEPVGEP